MIRVGRRVGAAVRVIRVGDGARIGTRLENRGSVPMLSYVAKGPVPAFSLVAAGLQQSPGKQSKISFRFPNPEQFIKIIIRLLYHTSQVIDFLQLCRG